VVSWSQTIESPCIPSSPQIVVLDSNAVPVYEIVYNASPPPTIQAPLLLSPMTNAVSVQPSSPNITLLVSSSPSSTAGSSESLSSSPIWANPVSFIDSTPPIPAIVLDGESISNLLLLAEPH
jgi:hypothetical protein